MDLESKMDHQPNTFLDPTALDNPYKTCLQVH
jgi:hypothetical protein